MSSDCLQWLAYLINISSLGKSPYDLHEHNTFPDSEKIASTLSIPQSFVK